MIDYSHGVLLKPIQKTKLATYIQAGTTYSAWLFHQSIETMATIDEPQITFNHNNLFYESYAIDDQVKLVGIGGFTEIDHFHQRAKLSIYFRPQTSDHVKLAFLKSLLDHAFFSLTFHSISAETTSVSPVNFIFEKAGLRRTGRKLEHYFKNTRYIDAVVWSILRNQWVRTDH